MIPRVPLAEFEEKALQLLEQVIATGQAIFITDQGKAILEMRPCPRVPVEALRGTVLYSGDLVSPIEADGYEPFK